jgi:hypothetical protein
MSQRPRRLRGSLLRSIPRDPPTVYGIDTDFLGVIFGEPRGPT